MLETSTEPRKGDRLPSLIDYKDTDRSPFPQARFRIRPDLICEGVILARRGDHVTVRWPNGCGAWLLASCIVVDDDLFARAA